MEGDGLMAVNQVQSTCAYCGAGCQIMFTVDTDLNKIIEAKPALGRTNDKTLCLKGRYGWDYINDPQILTKRLKNPMIRKGGKGAPLEDVSWDEAVNYVASRLGEIKKNHGSDSIMCTGSARGPGNEANYVMQKFARACLGTNNVDHCARI
jgi:formate dehydrogenase major subunit